MGFWIAFWWIGGLAILILLFGSSPGLQLGPRPKSRTRPPCTLALTGSRRSSLRTESALLALDGSTCEFASSEPAAVPRRLTPGSIGQGWTPDGGGGMGAVAMSITFSAPQGDARSLNGARAMTPNQPTAHLAYSVSN